MISGIESKQLLTLAKKGTAQEFSEALSQTGSAVLGNAVETFCQMDRESAQGQASVDQLKDLKNSLITYIGRHTAEVSANQTKGTELTEQVKSGSHPTHKLSGETVEHLENARSFKGQEVQYLERISKPEAAVFHTPQVDDLAGLRKFLTDLTEVQGLYTAAVMIPGPLALSVKNFAREVADGSSASSSSFSGESVSNKIFSHSASAVAGQSQSSSATHYEKTTVDERVVPVLTELQDRLAQASVVPASSAYVSADHHYQENQGRKAFLTGNLKYDKSIAYSYYDTDRIQRKLETFEFEPTHVRLPNTSISDFTGKK